MGAVKDTYTLELVDKILAPLKKIEAQGAKVVAIMEKLESLGEKGLGLVKLIPIASAALAGLWALKKGVEGLWWVLEKSGQAALGFGRAILSAVAFREKWKTMFAHQFGEEEGGQIYKKIIKAANVTPGTAAQLMENTGRLANVGMRDDNLNAMVGAMASVQAMFDDIAMEKFSRGMTDMYSKAKFEEQDFKQAVAGIIPAEVAQAQILRLKGIHVAADKVSETFGKLKKSGQISGREGFLGVLAAFQESVEKGKPIGSFAIERGSSSLEGLLSNLEEAPANFLRQLDKLDTLPGLRSFKDFIHRVLVFFDVATPQGQKLAEVVEKMTNALFGGFDRLTDDDLAHWFEGGVEVAKRFVTLVEKAWGVIGEILHGSWSSVLGAAAGFAVSLGAMIGEGIWQAFRASLAGSSPVLAKMLGFDAPVTAQLTQEKAGLKQRLAENPDDADAQKRLAEVNRVLALMDISHTHIPGRRDGTATGAWSNAWGSFGAAWSSATGSTSSTTAAGAKPPPPVVSHLQDVGAQAVEAIAEGARKRAEQMASPGPGDSHADNMVEALRSSAMRVGAPVT